ncbi:hypothetical protein BJ165DRAFT_1402872 [Panaeolus papilionaceus]|nr:hypothetical protein BJ165DRAFT_1402872 [Panaeolus papilionaceus]
MTLYVNFCFSSSTHSPTHSLTKPATSGQPIDESREGCWNGQEDWMPSQRLLTSVDYYFPIGVFLEFIDSFIMDCQLLTSPECILGCLYSAFHNCSVGLGHIYVSNLACDQLKHLQLYLVLITLMWLVACAHLGISIQRLLRIYVLEIEVGRKPHERILDPMKWDNMVHFLLLTAMVWLGDVLVIYRTYIVWNRSLRVVALPVIVHVGYMVANSICTYGFSHPAHIPRKITFAWFQAVFPLAFAQNVITTALLTYKTYSTHRVSRKNGATNTTPGAIRLGSLSWMLIETAMLYTLELLVMIVLNAIRHPATTIASVLLVPTLVSKVPNVLKDSGLVLDHGAAVAPLALTGAQRPVTPLSLDGDVDMDIFTLRRQDPHDSDGEEDRHSESFPVSISQRGSQEWL